MYPNITWLIDLYKKHLQTIQTWPYPLSSSLGIPRSAHGFQVVTTPPSSVRKDALEKKAVSIHSHKQSTLLNGGDARAIKPPPSVPLHPQFLSSLCPQGEHLPSSY